MKASEITLCQFLKEDNQFQIPLFQRRYSWHEKNWQILLKDLIDIHNGDVKSGYFIGTIVTQHNYPKTVHGISPFIVIDGQQRLITITLLLSVIRDFLRFSGNVECADDINKYLVNSSQTNNDFYKIFFPDRGIEWRVYQHIVSNDGNSLWKDLDLDFDCSQSIHNNKTRFSETRVFKAFRFFQEKVQQELRNSINFSRLKDIILHELMLVSIVADNDDNPYLIFERLNSTGLKLDQSDLIRNYVLMKSSLSPDKEEIDKEWRLLEKKFREIEEKINKKRWYDRDYRSEVRGKLLTQYFWNYLRKDGDSVTEKEVYKSMIEKFDAFSDKHKYLKELTQFSNYYERLCLPQNEPKEELSRYFYYFSELDFETCHIFLLNIYELYSLSKISCEDFENILCLLESYFIRRLFVGISTNILGKIFNNLYKEICSKDSANILLALRIILREYSGNKSFPQDKDFRSAIVSKNIYTTGNRKRLKFILERLNSSIYRNTKEKDSIFSDNLTVEHIMPQALTYEWRESLGDSYNAISNKWLHTLGNLTLTADNSPLSNKVFTEKKIIYKESNLNLNKYFNNIDNWNADTIEKRANELADIAINIWPMP
ncbi:DUF262 domain-containing protein [Chamaesiphon sp.]|uniref:DUF262 domain-containing protein n=1 Tax=Chamaesiphon sp. TaxID=2814140 RepID=UPI0035943C1D